MAGTLSAYMPHPANGDARPIPALLLSGHPCSLAALARVRRVRMPCQQNARAPSAKPPGPHLEVHAARRAPAERLQRATCGAGLGQVHAHAEGAAACFGRLCLEADGDCPGPAGLGAQRAAAGRPPLELDRGLGGARAGDCVRRARTGQAGSGARVSMGKGGGGTRGGRRRRRHARVAAVMRGASAPARQLPRPQARRKAWTWRSCSRGRRPKASIPTCSRQAGRQPAGQPDKPLCHPPRQPASGPPATHPPDKDRAAARILAPTGSPTQQSPPPAVHAPIDTVKHAAAEGLEDGAGWTAMPTLDAPGAAGRQVAAADTPRAATRAATAAASSAQQGAKAAARIEGTGGPGDAHHFSSGESEGVGRLKASIAAVPDRARGAARQSQAGHPGPCMFA
jgi:hypothetical protein